MTRNDITALLTQLLGPLKLQSQDANADFDKFQNLLFQALTQSTLEFRKSGVEFPGLHSLMLPEEVTDVLDKMADKILAEMPNRQPTDPVFWLRQRDLELTSGIEDSSENFIEPAFSFGPFNSPNSFPAWFDFYQAPTQLRFDFQLGGIPDYLIITLPAGASLPLPGRHQSLSFDDCTIWISAKTIAANGDKKYAGIRAKNCEIVFPTGIAIVPANGLMSRFSPTFTISFQPHDSTINGGPHNGRLRVDYPGKIVLSFEGTRWALKSIDAARLHVNGDNLEFGAAENIRPLFLDAENLVHFPLPVSKESIEIHNNQSEVFQLKGKGATTDPGWYLPVFSVDNNAGIGILGTCIFSGHFGLRGLEGVGLVWPGFTKGEVAINKFLLLGRPGRTTMKYTYDVQPKGRQRFTTWKANGDGESFSSVEIIPAAKGSGVCISDNQNLEVLIQPVLIAAKADRPLNSNQKRFDISDQNGAIEFIKIGDNTSVFIIGSKLPAPVDAVKKRKLLQSLCLHNALLTTGDPIGIFIKGRLLNNENIIEGQWAFLFRIHRIINTLPDPYISNQDGIFDLAEVALFNDRWRRGEDTLPEQFLFTIFSIIKWNNETANTRFTLNQSLSPNKITGDELLRLLTASGSQADESYHNEDIRKLVNVDFENVTGADGFLRLHPGNRCLVDVSDSANRWGVSFTDLINLNDLNHKRLPSSLGYQDNFPFSINGMDVVSSGRLSRLFTLPHIQWEPVMKIANPAVDNAEVPPIPAIIFFTDNGAPTRIASAKKTEVALTPRSLYKFIIEGYNDTKKPRGVAAHFTLPFGICAFTYFNPSAVENLPAATVRINEPAFTGKKTGEISGAMQVHVEAIPPANIAVTAGDNHHTYFIGSTLQNDFDAIRRINILGKDIGDQFNKEYSKGGNEKVPLERIDFSGYGASIFSNWLDASANFGSVSQVMFEVLIGRTAHEVIQIKSLLFPWGVPVVRSIVIERKNTGVVTRFDSGWVATGPGKFDFRARHNIGEPNPYHFHPGLVKGIQNVREIKNLPEAMDIPMINSLGNALRFTGVYFNGDIQVENIIKGALPNTLEDGYSLVHSVGQFGYVMLANPADIHENTTVASLFSPAMFRALLNDAKVGGNLGGPVNAMMNIAGSGQRMQATRVDVSASNEATPSFVVAVRGTVDFPKEGSWNVVKCFAAKAVAPLDHAEAVPVIRHGLLNPVNLETIAFNDSHHCLGDPAEIDKYAGNGATPLVQYSLLQTTGTQKLLFRRPSFLVNKNKIFHDTPELADAFRLLKCKTIFPDLPGTLSLPANVRSLNIIGDGNGLQFDESFFDGAENLNEFVPVQLKNDIASKEFVLLDEAGLQIIISYTDNKKPESASKFQVDLNSAGVDEAIENERKKWQTVNKDVAIKVNLGPLKPLLTLRGTFRSEAGKDPEFENPKCELGPELEAVKDILQVLALLAGKRDNDNLKVVMGNSPDAWNYKMSIDQNIPVIQFPSTEEITLATPPPLIIEASLSLGIFFNLSLSPDPKNLIKPGAGAVFGFEGMIQIQLITIGIAAAYGVGITKVKAYVDFTDPKPTFEFTLGFGATVIVDLPVVGLASITRSFSLSGNIDSSHFKAIAGQMLRGVLSLAGGLLIVAIQIEGSAGVERKDKVHNDPKTTAIFAMQFSLDVSLAFVVSYDFTRTYSEEIALN